MLTINKEFRKGILFVRLLGVLDKKTVKELESEVTSLVRDLVISNVVFNIEDLNVIDLDGINEILKVYEICKQNNGISLICGINKKIEAILCNSNINCMSKINNELKALDFIKI